MKLLLSSIILYLFISFNYSLYSDNIFISSEANTNKNTSISRIGYCLTDFDEKEIIKTDITHHRDLFLNLNLNILSGKSIIPNYSLSFKLLELNSNYYIFRGRDINQIYSLKLLDLKRDLNYKQYYNFVDFGYGVDLNYYVDSETKDFYTRAHSYIHQSLLVTAGISNLLPEKSNFDSVNLATKVGLDIGFKTNLTFTFFPIKGALDAEYHKLVSSQNVDYLKAGFMLEFPISEKKQLETKIEDTSDPNARLSYKANEQYILALGFYYNKINHDIYSINYPSISLKINIASFDFISPMYK